MYLLVALVLLLLAAPVTGEGRTEQKILEAVQSQKNDAIRFLETVTNVNSGTFNPEGVREVGRIFREEFDRLGMQTTWIPQDGVNRGGHLVAEQPGTRGFSTDSRCSNRQLS